MEIEFVPPKEVFEIPPQDPVNRVSEGSYQIPGFKEVTRSKDGEPLSVYEGFPLPRKGIVYSEAIMANAEAKKRTLTTFVPFARKEALGIALGFFLTPFKWKIVFLEEFLRNYVREIDNIHLKCKRPAYLKYEYYSNFAKALWDITKVFMMELGFSEVISNHLGKILATLFEYDDVYKIQPIDVFTEFTKEEVLKDPRGFIDRFIKLIIQRNVNTNLSTWKEDRAFKDNKTAVQWKFEAFATLLKIALYLPKFKRAFRKAISEVKFEWLQMDEYERFWNLNRGDYNIEGRKLKDRYEEYVLLRIEHMKKTTGKEVRLNILPTNEVEFYLI